MIIGCLQSEDPISVIQHGRIKKLLIFSWFWQNNSLDDVRRYWFTQISFEFFFRYRFSIIPDICFR